MNILLLTDNLLGVIGGTNDYVKNILKYIRERHLYERKKIQIRRGILKTL